MLFEMEITDLEDMQVLGRNRTAEDLQTHRDSEQKTYQGAMEAAERQRSSGISEKDCDNGKKEGEAAEMD
jgi:hypothetical protein